MTRHDRIVGIPMWGAAAQYFALVIYRMKERLGSGMSLNALRGALCLDCVAAALKNHLVFFLQNFSENIPTAKPIIDPIITTSIAAHT